jgi:hypothetical protein
VAKVSPAILNFNAGELSPFLDGRLDLEKYNSGCRRMRDWIPMLQGPAAKRPGTGYIAEAKNAAETARLIPFEYSNQQAYRIWKMIWPTCITRNRTTLCFWRTLIILPIGCLG